jgi:hydrogenase expression/formation protein HypC
MCLAVPSRIIKVDDLVATVDVMGARREVNLTLLPEEAGVGDFVLVHAGFAIQKVDRHAAKDSIELISELLRIDEQIRRE